MQRLPRYTSLDLVVGVLNMMHFGALLLAAGLIFAGWLLANGGDLASFALISLGVIIVLIQILSRLRHVWRLRVLREKAGCLEVLLRSSGKWIPAAIAKARKEHYDYADPWRPMTVGYPGIKLELHALDEPVEVLYPYGLEYFRDRVYGYLACKMACGSLRQAQPSWEVCDARLRASEPDRFVVAVFFQQPGMPSRPAPYKLFAVSQDLSRVEELPCNPESPYWIRGRK